MVFSCACFDQGIHPTANYLCRVSDMAAVRTIFSFDAVWVRDTYLRICHTIWLQTPLRKGLIE